MGGMGRVRRPDLRSHMRARRLASIDGASPRSNLTPWDKAPSTAVQGGRRQSARPEAGRQRPNDGS